MCIPIIILITLLCAALVYFIIKSNKRNDNK